jgi:hypothetical protein
MQDDEPEHWEKFGTDPSDIAAAIGRKRKIGEKIPDRVRGGN